MYLTQSILMRTLLVLLLSYPLFSFAQTSPDISSTQSYQDTVSKLLEQRIQDAEKQTEFQKSATGAYLDVQVFPPSPGPNTPVQISIESYLTDLFKANIAWSLNGTVVSRGVGRTSFNFKTGPSGETTHVSLSFTSNTGEVVNKDFYFTPVGATIMWEADTYTPPFYKGKALLSYEAGVRIIALPNTGDSGNPLGTGDLVYLWKKDGNPIASSSGFNKNTFSFTSPRPLTQAKIGLEVSSLDDRARSEMQIYLPQTSPFILFYKDDPLLGTQYEKPFFDTTTLNSGSLSLVAEPYFFSNEVGEGAPPTLRYSWLVNGKTIKNYGRTITLRNSTGEKGSSLVSLAMRGVSKTFQSAKRNLVINFTESNPSVSPIF